MTSKGRFASVIVDVPAQATDHPFDYEIPEHLADQVEIGCRVRVPFGTRVLQGYVVEIKSRAEVAKVRPIREVVDLVPPLNEELVQLAKWMSDTFFTQRVTALEAMLPAVLKARYKRVLRLGRSEVSQVELLEDAATNQLLEAVQSAKKRSAFAGR